MDIWGCKDGDTDKPTHEYLEWMYPNIYLPPGQRSTLEIGLCHVRASDSIRISYDGPRNGWLIEQAITYDHGQRPDGVSEEEVWEEVAFVESWAKERCSVCGRTRENRKLVIKKSPGHEIALHCTDPFHEVDDHLISEEIEMLRKLEKGSSWGELSEKEAEIIDRLEDKGIAFRTSDSIAYGLTKEGVDFLSTLKETS